MKTRFALVLSLVCSLWARAESLDLSGAWDVSLADPRATPIWQQIRLPGTLDDHQIGTPLTLKPELTIQVLGDLQRRFVHIGPAWFRRSVDVPAGWAGKVITLKLERVRWQSRVFVDGREVSRADSLAAPHRHDPSSALTPGHHELVVQIGNREIHRDISHHTVRYEVPSSFLVAHAYTNPIVRVIDNFLRNHSFEARVGAGCRPACCATPRRPSSRRPRHSLPPRCAR